MGRRRTLDVALLIWAAVWVWVGIWVAREVQGLAELSETVRRSGIALLSAGDLLAGVPLIGDEPAETLREAGRRAVESARASERNARQVGTLLGVSIALIPSLPLLILYVPQRIAEERERRALQRLLRQGRDPALDELLAVRALARLPLSRLGELRDAGDRALADAELERLGLRPER